MPTTFQTDALSMNSCIKTTLAAFSLVAGLSLQTSLQAQSSAPDPSLKLHLDFEQDFSGGRVLDVSGNGSDGWQFSPTNWITVTNGVFGGTAGQFTYVGYMSNDFPHVYPLSQYIAVTNVSGFEYLTNGTISLWAQFGPNTDGGTLLLDSSYAPGYTRDPALSSNSWFFGRANTTYLCFAVYSSLAGYQILVNWPVDVVRWGGSSPDLSTTQFHLYTVTIDCPNNRAVAYYDGNPYMTNSIGVPWIRIYGCYSQRWLCIGALSHDGTPQWGDDQYPNSGFFAGKMDDIRIYNRTLPAYEVQALYHGSTYAQNLGIKKAAPQSVQIYWPSKTNVTYQVEYPFDLLSGTWFPLGTPIAGNGLTNCALDSIAGRLSRFYRVRVLP